jgi:hypothetical protein
MGSPVSSNVKFSHKQLAPSRRTEWPALSLAYIPLPGNSPFENLGFELSILDLFSKESSDSLAAFLRFFLAMQQLMTCIS